MFKFTADNNLNNGASRVEAELEFTPKAVVDGNHVILQEMENNNLTVDMTRSLRLRQSTKSCHYKTGIGNVDYNNENIGVDYPTQLLNTDGTALLGTGLDDEGSVMNSNANDKVYWIFVRHMGVDASNKYTEVPIMLGVGQTYSIQWPSGSTGYNNRACIKLDSGEAMILPMQFGFENDPPAMTATGDTGIRSFNVTTAEENSTVKLECCIIYARGT